MNSVFEPFGGRGACPASKRQVRSKWTRRIMWPDRSGWHEQSMKGRKRNGGQPTDSGLQSRQKNDPPRVYYLGRRHGTDTKDRPGGEKRPRTGQSNEWGGGGVHTRSSDKDPGTQKGPRRHPRGCSASCAFGRSTKCRPWRKRCKILRPE